MIDEFKRFGLNDIQRKATGILQILGSIGLFAGFFLPYIGLLSATGFTAMMFVAFIVRVKIKDSVAQAAPSFFFLIINAWLVIEFYGIL
jgi:hypothetical protein